MLKFVDTHCHLSLIKSEYSFSEIASMSFDRGIDYVINVAIDFYSYRSARDFHKSFSRVLPSCGLYPSSAPIYNEAMRKELISYIEGGELVAIGECGLDYYRSYGTRGEQIKLFEDQVCLAREYSLPLIVHTRNSFEDVYSILKRYSPLSGGVVMHCYSGDSIFVRKFLALGCFISFAGNITYKSAVSIREAAMEVPLDRLLLETDSPYLSPLSSRGKTNYPWRLPQTAECVAGIKDISLSELSAATYYNSVSLFKLS